MSIFRRLTFSRASVPVKNDAPADQLRVEMAALEKELGESQLALANLETKMRELQTRAIEAIRAGDDRAARAGFLEQQSLAENATALAADLRVLRAILDECYDFVNAMAKGPPPRP